MIAVMNLRLPKLSKGPFQVSVTQLADQNGSQIPDGKPSTEDIDEHSQVNETMSQADSSESIS